ncbi:hypothetical protein WICMUC_004059 [Wickerhamomyces mucosus]|uniref:Meiosis protein 5 n=1 Tax=Wickerhamomyces mucosus TaxID=1378264 RepID=A0A9P8PK82_9ASCO|nr:hypothetical protein WICMUC_004059 [Wickerhamomyces mucosus]
MQTDETCRKDTDFPASTVIPLKASSAQSLPPVDKLVDDSQPESSKKQKLNPDYDIKEELNSKKIPLKQTIRSDQESSRVQSLNETEKPDLTPPRSLRSYESINEKSPINETTLSNSVAEKIQVQANIQKAAIELRREENSLDSQLRTLRTRLQTVKAAKKIIFNNEIEKTSRLIDKWRDVTQKASNYLLNSALEKVNKQGGKKEFVKREKEGLRETMEYSVDSSFQDKYQEVTQSYEFKVMDEKDRNKWLESLEIQQQKEMEDIDKSLDLELGNDDENDDDDFTMRDLYKRLKMNYKLVYPDSIN